MKKIIFIYLLLIYSVNASSELNENLINKVIEEQAIIQSNMGIMSAVLTFCGNAEPSNTSYRSYKEGFLNYATHIAGDSSGQAFYLIEKYKSKDIAKKFEIDMNNIIKNSYFKTKDELKSLNGEALLKVCSIHKQKINNNDYKIIEHAQRIFEIDNNEIEKANAVPRILNIDKAYTEFKKLKLD